MYIYTYIYMILIDLGVVYMKQRRVMVPADLVCRPQKVVRPTALFSNSKHLFVRLLVCRPTGRLADIDSRGALYFSSSVSKIVFLIAVQHKIYNINTNNSFILSQYLLQHYTQKAFILYLSLAL